jgi:hypothetical protein
MTTEFQNSNFENVCLVGIELALHVVTRDQVINMFRDETICANLIADFGISILLHRSVVWFTHYN